MGCTPNKTSRRRLLASLFSLPALMALSVGALSIGQPTLAEAAKTANLKERLEKVLKARRPVEFNFIARVVALVENDTLPQSIVDSTFLWARKKPRNQFQYFERALRLRASRLGITI